MDNSYLEDGEYLEIAGDILDSEIFKSMDKYIMHGNTTCREHCIQVSYMAYRICKSHGMNYAAAARAGLLHDMFLYDWHTHFEETGNRFHGFTHPRVAMENAKKYFNIGKLEQNMILRHMWPLTPIPPKSFEGMVLLYADKVCSAAETMHTVRRILNARFEVE